MAKYPDIPCDHKGTQRIRIPFKREDDKGNIVDDVIVLCGRCYKDMKYETRTEEDDSERKERH